jgi:hypothetical protein
MKRPGFKSRGVLASGGHTTFNTAPAHGLVIVYVLPLAGLVGMSPDL